MTIKQILWTKAAEAIAKNGLDFEHLNNTESRKKAIGVLYREMLKAYERGVEIGGKLNEEFEQSPAEVSA